MVQGKVTRNELKSMKVGESREFHLTGPDACSSAAVTASQMQVVKDDTVKNTDVYYKFKCKCPMKQKMEGIIIIKRIS